MISAQAAKKYADAHLRASGSTFVALHAAKSHEYGVRVVSYGDPDRPDEQLDGGALVVTDRGFVHDVDSTPGAVARLMDSLDDGQHLVGGVPGRPWPEVLGEEIRTEAFATLLRKIEQERRSSTVYPAAEEVFAAFDLTPFDQVRVVILGQDPYHQPGQANGLCFSVPRNLHKLPPSLRNIHAGLESAGFGPQHHGDLTCWAEQGVLLLNTALTVRRSEANSHATEWREFTDAVITVLSGRKAPVVFVLWGQAALAKAALIDAERHPIVTAPHPAARGAQRTEFRRGRTFVEVNKLLDDPIDWAIT